MRIGADTEDTAHLAQPQHQVQVLVLPLDSRDYNLRYAHEPALSYIEGGRGGRESGLFSSEQRSNGSSLSRSPLSSNECALALLDLRIMPIEASRVAATGPRARFVSQRPRRGSADEASWHQARLPEPPRGAPSKSQRDTCLQLAKVAGERVICDERERRQGGGAALSALAAAQALAGPARK